MNLKKYNIKFDCAVRDWEQSLPIGNGKIGCMIYGEGSIYLSIDRIDLWDKRINDTVKDRDFTFKKLVEYSTEWTDENVKKRNRLFEDVYDKNAYPTKITAGKIIIDFGYSGTDIISEVDLKTAVATVQLPGGMAIESFCSATNFIGIAKVQGDYRLSIRIPSYISNPADDNNLGYPKAEIITDGNYCWYKQKTFTDYSYGIVIYINHCNGYDELYYDVASGEDGDDFISAAKQRLTRFAREGYDSLKKRHISWWSRYWKKSELCIEDKLLESAYYRFTYFFASCSRKDYPIALQGVWTADDVLPPWRGDYHYDTNIQLTYSAYLKANRLEEGKVLLDYLWNNRETFERFTKRFYGVSGMLLPACSTIDGTPLAGWAHYSLSPTMTIWTIRCFDEYYLYTADESYLKSRVFPVFEKVGEAISALLVEKDGKLYLPLSSSPEIFDNTKDAYLQPNSNFDLALLIYLYKRLEWFAGRLGTDSTKYTKILSELDDIAIDNDGVVLLDRRMRLPESHRHFSHTMCMHPLRLIQYDTPENKHIYEQTLRHLEQLGTGMWVGFSYTMSANLYAMAQNGNAAYNRMEEFVKAFLSDNGFHLNGDFRRLGLTQWHYHPFTLEACFAFCDAMQETLLQEQQGYVYLFPAVPEKMQSASFKNFRTYGGVLVDAVYYDGYSKSVTFKAKTQRNIKIKNTFHSNKICVETRLGKNYIECPCGDIFEVKLHRGATKIYCAEDKTCQQER